MNNMNAFDLTVSSLRDKGLNSDEILEELSKLFRKMVDEGQKENIPKSLTDIQKEEKLRALFLELGIPRHLKGYLYIIKAVLLYNKNPEQKLVNELYPAVAKEFNTTSSRVERAIRHAVMCAWDRSALDVLYRFFGNTISASKGKPTNHEFIAMCAEWLNQEP